MIRLTNLADYAIVLLSQMVRENNQLVSAQYLSDATSLPIPTISKILGALGRADILESHRGLKGGFKLSRPASDISVAEVIEAIEGPIALTNCITTHEEQSKDCSIVDLCQLRTSWNIVNAAIKDALHGVSLEDITMPHSPDSLSRQVRSAIAGNNRPETTA